MIENKFLQQLQKYQFPDSYNHVNWLFEIKDSDLRKDFRAFGYYLRQNNFFALFICIAVFFIIPGEIMLISSVYEKLVLSLRVLSIIYLLSIFAMLGSSFFYLFSRSSTYLYRFDLINNTFFILTITIFICLRLTRTSLFPCLDNNDSYNYLLGKDCEVDRDILTWDTGSFLIFPPLLFITIIKETRLWLVICSFLITFATICSLLLKNNWYSILTLVIWVILGLFLIVHTHIQSIKTYFLKRKLIETLFDNENNEQQNQAIEMRHMIANVAHDLKTPLSSFTSGTDLIEQVLFECQDQYNSSKLTLKSCYEKFHTIGQYLEDIRNTNSFMLMTINRCIDYTKASKGMKLVPRYETIDLMDTLGLPLNCMKNIQNRIEINLKPISGDICSHIITDKQWLQENVLCLLSNAVKYSSGGQVTITIELQKKNDSIKTTLTNSPMKVKLLLPKRLSSRSEFKSPSFKGSCSNLSADDNSNKNSIGKKYLSFSSMNSFLMSSEDGNYPVELENVPEGNEDEESIEYLKFEIEDTGIGMTDEAMQSLFNPFKQTQRLAGGTGLGLYSLAKRVESLNGKYGVMRRRDGKQGSLFWFSIPYKPDTVVSMLSTKAIEGSHSFRRPHHNLHIVNLSSLSSVSMSENIVGPSLNPDQMVILVVDDSPAILKMTSMMLRRQKHLVETAENGAIAVKMIEDRWKEKGCTYDLVLMDLQMPVMDGLEATRRLRALETLIIDAESPIQTKSKLKPDSITKSVRSLNIAFSFKTAKSSQKVAALELCTETSLDDIENIETQTNQLESKESSKVRPKQIIVGCSANSDNETTEEAFKAGVDAFMAKPFTVDAFNATAKRLLNTLGSRSFD